MARWRIWILVAPCAWGPRALALTLGPPAAFGSFIPGVTQDYSAATTAQVTSTGADAALSVLDASSTATGRLTNGTYALTDPLQIAANSGNFAPVRQLWTWRPPRPDAVDSA